MARDSGSAGIRPAARRPHGTHVRSAGQFSRWGPSDRHRPRSGRNSLRHSPARRATAERRPVLPVGASDRHRGPRGPRNRVQAVRGVVPVSARTRAGKGGAQARERRPPASSPGGGRHAAPSTAKPRMAATPGGRPEPFSRVQRRELGADALVVGEHPEPDRDPGDARSADRPGARHPGRDRGDELGRDAAGDRRGAVPGSGSWFCRTGHGTIRPGPCAGGVP